MRIKHLSRHDYVVTARDPVSGKPVLAKFTVTDQVYMQRGGEYIPVGAIEGSIHGTLERITRSHGLV